MKIKSLKRLLFGIALILVAIWGVLCTLLLMRDVWLVISLLILIAGLVFVFLGLFTDDTAGGDDGTPRNQ